MAEAGGVELSASLEDYLEAIFWIVRDKRAARARDIGKRMAVGRSSVTGALQALSKKELINYAPYDLITLTDRGQAAAEIIVRRHEVLRDFFVRVLSVGQAQADEAACKMEHAIPEVILDRFVDFVDFVERCPRGGTKWIRGFGYYCENGKQTGDCVRCVEAVLDGIKDKEKDMADAACRRKVSLGALRPGDKGRSEERRVGKECRAGWAPCH